jgi:prophage regulatory protein
MLQLVHGGAPRQRDRFLRRSEVYSTTGLSRSTIDKLEAAGKFPRRVQLSSNCVGWPESAVLQWVQDRIAESALTPMPQDTDAGAAA